MKAILDIETGGFSADKNGLCELAVVIFNENFVIEHSTSWIIKPYKRLDSDELVSYKDDAMAVNGISLEQLKIDGQDIENVLHNFICLLHAYDVTHLVRHNIAKFDIPFLGKLLERFLELNLDSWEVEDTLQISREKLNIGSHSLKTVCNYFKIENKDEHRALGDCFATLEVYKKLINRK